MDENQLAAILYPSTSTGAAADPGEETALGGIARDFRPAGQPVLREENVELLSDEEMAARMFGDDPGAGEPLDSPAAYHTVAGDFFDGFEFQARYDKNTEESSMLAESRAGLAEAMHEYGVGRSEGKALMGEALPYFQNPKTPEAMDLEAANTEATLRQRWGSAYTQNLEAARRMAVAIERRVPNFRAKLAATGYGNNLTLITTLARAGNRR